MTDHRPTLFGFSALLALTALGPLPGCEGFGPRPHPPASAGTSLRISCDETCGCSAYEGCVRDGVVWCESRTCYTDGITDLSCVDAMDRVCTPASPPLVADAGAPWTPPASAGCGLVDAPIEQQRQTPDRVACWFHQPRPSWTRYEFGWIVAVAGAAGGTIEVVRANVLGVRYDGTIVPIQGSALGQRPFTYAGFYSRSPWFGTADAHTDAPLPPREPWVFDVPPNGLIHIILGGEDVSAYREAYMMVQARTTGDVQFQVGLDYDSNLTVDFVDGVAEVRPDGGVSSWGRCSDGGTITLSNPISTEPTFCGYRPIVASTPPPPPSGSREFVFEPGARFRTTDSRDPAYCPSGWVTTVWGPTAAENLVSAPGGSIRSTAPMTWGGYTALTMECASPHHWMDWDPWRARTLADVPSLGTLTMCGRDVRAMFRVEDMAYARPIVVWSEVRSGCP